MAGNGLRMGAELIMNQILCPLDNFEMTDDDEITLKGFLDLHVMTAEDEEGGEGEIWEILDAMGYSKQLRLDQVMSYDTNLVIVLPCII